MYPRFEARSCWIFSPIPPPQTIAYLFVLCWVTPTTHHHTKKWEVNQNLSLEDGEGRGGGYLIQEFVTTPFVCMSPFK